MGKLYPELKHFKVTDIQGIKSEWTAPGLEMLASVVCKDCNEGWMSDIESEHAKPVLTPLISGNGRIPFGSKQARSLAIFAFKSSVVVDHNHTNQAHPFFSRRLRDAFRRNLFIPQNVAMWLAPFSPEDRKRRFNYRMSLHKGDLTPGYQIQILVCTFTLGALVFQVVAHKQLFAADFAPLPGFENLAVPFWPILQPDYVWPGYGGCLRNREDLLAFHNRWSKVLSP